MPLFLFHILEYMNVDFDLDVDEINERWEELASRRPVEPDDHEGDRRHRAAADGHAAHRPVLARRQRRAGVPQTALDWHQLQNESEAFFLRIYGPGDYRWKGADLGVLVTKGRLQVDSAVGKSALAIRARHLIDSIRAELQVHRSPSPRPPDECRA